ncbi:uncharacterized protein LOC129566229 [Sitodiplosis mosellana]|uniref:uncharacterized protein LOC129566229 n=1 Tax=Sitodiplosis mosellana TaxID=263140 RepID=UPI002444103A|nr:uncharacterized protein LOC129566229 [Sitodiplosis mosellana]
MGKRKISVKSDDGDEVTAKLLKTTSNDVDKKLGLADEDNDAAVANKEEELQEETPLPVSKKPFVPKKFRDALRRNDFITEIRIFLQKAESDVTIVPQFLQSGGKPLEIAQVLNKVDKNELFHISYVFSALHLVLMEKMNQENHLNRDAVEVCAYVLNNHRVCIEKLLSSNYATHKKSVLKLLTDTVYLAPHLGRELLTTFNVAFNSETLQRFTAHDRNEANLPDEERVRSCYIYFILSFIIEGNHVLIKNLLDRNEMLMALLSGLTYDSKETVLLVLNSFLKFVLQSGVVSKTKKVQVFTANVVNELIRLLEWKGPAYFAAISHKKTKDKAAQFINVDDQNTVCDTVYLFLCELLASRKNGIAFKTLGQRQLKSNGIQKEVLVKMDHFMGNSYKANLVIEILKACPELMKKFVQKHASCLDSFKKNNNWFEAVDFFAKLIDSLTPDIIQYQNDKMNAKETIELIKDICMAPEILQQLRNKNTLRSEKLNVRQKSTNLLYLMFKQCNQYLFKMSQWNVHRANELKKIKFDLINHILTLCPTVENILLSLHMSQVDETADSEKMFEHLECILDLLLIITQSIPSFIDTTSSVINYIKILGPIYELNRELESSTRIEFKAVKLMLALEPKALSPKTKLFGQIIQSFFNVYRFGAPKERTEVKHLLRTVFLNTGLFENGPLEIDLWLAAIDHIDEDSLTSVREFLVEQINSYDANNFQITQINSQLPSSLDKNLTETFENIEKGTTLKGLLDVATLRPFFLHVVQSIQQLPDTKDDDEENDEKAEILEYIETVAFYLFHYLPSPESVYYAIEPIAQKYSSYMKKWIVQSKAGKFPKEFPSNCLSKLYESLMENSHDTLVSIFDDQLTAVMETTELSDKSNDLLVNLNGTDYKLSPTLTNETEIMVLNYTLMFVTNQRHKNNTLTNEQCTQAIKYLSELWKILDVIAATARETNEHGFELNESEVNPSVKALKYVFSNCYYLLQSFDIWSKESQITRFVYETVKNMEYTEAMDAILVHYRKKISNQIVVSVEQGANLSEQTHENLIDLLNTFHLDADNCCEILTSLSQLNYEHFVTPQNEISTYAGILSYALRRLAELKERAAKSSIIAGISELYVCLSSNVNVEINYQVIEEALVAYLSVYYHHLSDVHDDLFAAIFRAKRLNKAVIKLACLLLERKTNLIDGLPKLIEDNMPKKELIYPLLNVVAVKRIDLSDKLLAKLYAEYKNGIMKTIEKPAKAAVIYKENVLSSVFLIEKCMSIKECTDFLKKTVNFEGADVFQLQIIKSIHLKVLMHSDNVDAIRQSYENFLAIFVRLFGTLSKHEPLDMKKVNCFIYIAYDWTKLKLKLLPSALSLKLEYEQICGTQLWIQLGKSCLKHGMRLQKDDTNKIKEDAAGLLKIFAYLCNEFYANDANNEDAKLFFEMVVSHPSFFDIITMQQKTQLKTNLAYLLYVLVRKNAEVIESNHIPILLAGYQGKMSFSDQYILAILQMYERNECDMRKYRPFIFGENALSYYSLNSSTKPSLLQEPQDQVMALFDADISENTLVNFPVWRKLNVIDQVPAVDFTCHGIIGQEHSNNVSIAKSTVEKLVELGEYKNRIDPTVLTESARRDETFENVYDPAFLIPLMQMAFAPEACTKPLRPAQNGMLAITFACLSSADKDMRLAAATAFQRYRNHMESARFVDNKLWIHIFNAIRNGVQNLTLEAQKRKKHRIPRIPYIAGVFFARTINTLMNPLSELYRPLSTFLLIKNSFDFMTVPEFNVLFHSPDVNHNIHRSFILDVLRDGLKTTNDFNVLISNHIFKALLGYYGAPTTTRERNIQILTVVNAAAKIPKSAKLLIDVVGILPWLSNVADNIEFFQFDFLDIFCTILNNLYNSVAVNRDEYGTNTVNSIEIQMLHILLKICPNLSQRIAEVSFVRYVNVLKSIAVKRNRCQFLSTENITHLIKCMAGYVNTDLAWDCNFLMENTQAYLSTEGKFEYNRKLREYGTLNEQTIFIVSSLREIIICWQNAKHS